jgi:hypothetical protein
MSNSAGRQQHAFGLEFAIVALTLWAAFPVSAAAKPVSFKIGELEIVIPDLSNMAPDARLGPESEYLPVPGGMLLHKSCIYEVPPNTVSLGPFVYAKDGTFLSRFPPCEFLPRQPPPTVNGWVVDSIQTPSGQHLPWFTFIDSTWHVPNSPSLCGFSTRYWFNGLFSTDSTNNVIVQPVLQYDPTPCQWKLSNWVVYTNGPAYHDAAFNPQVGDLIEGTVNKLAGSCSDLGNNCLWNITFRDNTHPYSQTALFAAAGVMSRANAGTLEVYNVNFCSEFPSPGVTTFVTAPVREAVVGGIDAIVQAAMVGQNFGGAPACGYNVSVSNDLVNRTSTTTLSY